MQFPIWVTAAHYSQHDGRSSDIIPGEPIEASCLCLSGPHSIVSRQWLAVSGTDIVHNSGVQDSSWLNSTQMAGIGSNRTIMAERTVAAPSLAAVQYLLNFFPRAGIVTQKLKLRSFTFAHVSNVEVSSKGKNLLLIDQTDINTVPRHRNPLETSLRYVGKNNGRRGRLADFCLTRPIISEPAQLASAHWAESVAGNG